MIPNNITEKVKITIRSNPLGCNHIFVISIPCSHYNDTQHDSGRINDKVGLSFLQTYLPVDPFLWQQGDIGNRSDNRNNKKIDTLRDCSENGWAISEASGSAQVKHDVCLFLWLSVNTITLERVEIQPCALKPDSKSKSSAAIDIRPSSLIFKGSCHEALRDDFTQNFGFSNFCRLGYLSKG